MKTLPLFCIGILLCILSGNSEIAFAQKFTNLDFDPVSALKEELNNLSAASENEFFQMHCESIIQVIEAKSSLTAIDTSFILEIYNAFIEENEPGRARELISYLNRQRSFILAWTSPTDGNVSYSWLRTPANWDPATDYPLYVQLHGYWDVADNPIEYLAYPFESDPSTSYAFEDGYLLSPWGRGNLWYKDISETDIWECMYALEELVLIDPTRKYICGHSMGGYGAWYIGSRSSNTWAALGIHAGAIWYQDPYMLSDEVINTLRDVPIYFVCGTTDGNLSINQTAYNLLEDAGNSNLPFDTFEGGHDYRSVDVEGMYSWMRQFENNEINSIELNPLAEATVEFNIYYTHTGDIIFNYVLAHDEKVDLQILDIEGRVVEVLSNEYKYAGEHKVSRSSLDFSEGMYLCCFRTNATRMCKKLIVF